MTYIIDRRKNIKGKSLGNRERFIKRVKENVRKAVKEAVQNRKISEVEGSEKINIPIKDVREPTFRNSSKTGKRGVVHPGNDKFNEGDQVEKPQGGAGSGGGNKGEGASDDPTVSEDEFEFTLSKEEFLDIFFEDLELPDLVKKDLKEIKNYQYHRAGHTSVGNPSNLNIERSMMKSMSRRIALRRPKPEELLKIIEEIENLEKISNRTEEQENRLQFLISEKNRIENKLKAIPFIDPIDLRYNLFVPQPLPSTKAVMFCLMDVSGSMGEREKDIAKRFFMLLYLFLTRRYERIDLVFIRHHTEAKEVTEEEFFYSKESGGTIISSSLVLMDEIIKKRYPVNEWNIYGAQASDGENFNNDSAKCQQIMSETLMPLIQYFAYIEIVSEYIAANAMFYGSNTDSIWWNYSKVQEKFSNFSSRRIANIKEIFPVFRDLFTKK